MSSPLPDGPRERCGPATRWTEASLRVLMSLGSNCSTQEALSKGLRHTSRASGSVRVQSPPTSYQGPWPPNRCVLLGSFLLTNHQLLACPLLPLSHSPPTPWRKGPTLPRAKACVGGGSAPRRRGAVHGVPALDWRAVPAAHPTVPIALVVLRAAAGARLVARRLGPAARAEPGGPVLPTPGGGAPVEAPGTVEAAVIGRDVPGG